MNNMFFILNLILICMCRMCCAIVTDDIQNKLNRNFDNSLSDVYQNNILETNSINNSLDVDFMSSNQQSFGLIHKTAEEFKVFSNNVLSNLLPIEERLKQSLYQFLNSVNLTEECLSATINWFQGLRNGELWAYQFLDANGKLPSGVSEGVISSLGEYDQCLAIKSSHKTEQTIINGKYCLVKPVVPIQDFSVLDKFDGLPFLNNHTNQWLKTQLMDNINKFKLLVTVNQVSNRIYGFYLGICIPDRCQPKDIENLLKSVIGPILPIPIEVGPECDTSAKKFRINPFNLIVIIIPLTLIVLVMISTVYSFQSKYRNPNQSERKYFDEIMKSFSLFESNRQLFRPFKDHIPIVDGLMLVMALWYSISMHYSAILGSGVISYKKILNSFAVNVLTEPEYFWLRTMFPRNSLFLISGILISTKFFGNKTKSVRFLSYFKFLLSKWYQFSLKMIGPIILLNVLVIIGDGPLFSIFTQVNSCPKSFWKNFLFFNNFVKDGSDICAPPTWIYSVLFQLNIISPLFLLTFTKSFGFGLTFNLFAIVLTGFLKIVPKLFFDYELVPYEISNLNTIPDMKKSLARYFFFTDQYIYLFIFGLLIGYLIRRRKQLIKQLTKSNISIVLLSIFSYLSMILAVVWSENFKDINEDKHPANLMSWFVFGDILWSFGIIWTIFLFQQNKNGILQKFLSSRIISALTRLKFSIVINLSIISVITIFVRRYTVALNHINQIQFLYIDLSLTLIVSYLMYILLEYPFNRLINVLKNGRNFIDYKTNTNLVNNNQIETELTNNGQAKQQVYLFE